MNHRTQFNQESVASPGDKSIRERVIDCAKKSLSLGVKKKMDLAVINREDVNTLTTEQPAVALSNNASMVKVAADGEGDPIPPPSPLGAVLMPEPESEPSSEPGHESMVSLVAFEGDIVITDQVIRLLLCTLICVQVCVRFYDSYHLCNFCIPHLHVHRMSFSVGADSPTTTLAICDTETS